jgi:hypothetical protein
MAQLTSALAANRAAVDAFLAVVDQSGSIWNTPRAPHKWTPAQVTEHVARTYDESAKLFAGQATQFPKMPGLLRPVIRAILFNRVVRKGTFPKAKTSRPMDPATGPATPAEGRKRLEAAVNGFERQARAIGASGDAQLSSLTFGSVSLCDWARFQEVHTRHHQAQLKVDA